MVACYDDNSFLHEPRALWTVQAISQPENASVALDGRVQVDKDHFRNVSRYPMTLTHVLVSAINYTFREYTGNDPATGLSDVHNSQAIQNLVEVFLSAPYSRHITGRKMKVSGLPTEGRANPQMGFASTYASSLWGVSRWDFDRTLWLPSKAQIQFDVSGYSLPPLSGLSDQTIAVSVGFDEAHTGQFGGNNRQFVRKTAQSISDPNNIPFGSDEFGNPNTGAFTGTWPSQTKFNPRDWAKQDTNRGQRMSAFTGFAVAVDQIDFDEHIQTLAGNPPDNPVAPYASRLAVRAKAKNGGSDEWWWREGAPLCLVTPTITDALVYRLPEPITLEPGEQLEAEIEVPVATETSVTLGAPFPTLQVGVSLTGYASIEG